MTRLYELTLPQRAMWQIDRFYHDSCYVNIGGTILINEQVIPELFNKAINTFIQNNDAMRLRIANHPDPWQYIVEYEEHNFELKDFSHIGGSNDLHCWAIEEMKKPFDNDSDLFYFNILKLSGNQGGFYVKLHHIISDAWGISLLIHDVLTIYWSLKNGLETPIERASYLEYIQSDLEYRTSEKYEKDRTFWMEEFNTLPELTALKRGTSIAADRKTYIIPAHFVDKINYFCKSQQISNFVFLFSVFSILISRKTEKQDIVIGTPVLNRRNFKQKNIMGLFMHTIPFRIYNNNQLSFLENAKQISSHWMKLLRALRFPYHLILKEFRDKHKTKENLFEIAFSYQNNKIDFHETPYETDWKFNGAETSCLSVSFNDREDEKILKIDYDYQTDVFTEADIEQLHDHFVNLIEKVLTNPEAKISQLIILSEQERQRLLYLFNDTARERPQSSIQQLFEASVADNPQQTAVVFEDNFLSYTELNRRVNQLANHLRLNGATRKTVVGVVLKRSMDVIIGLLAVLKAGAIYVPIEPNYPKERIAFILHDSGCSLILSHSDVELPNDARLEKIFLDDLSSFEGDSSNLDCITKPEDTAYVIYTSGSTGVPKGVMVTQQGLCNFVHAIPEVIDFSRGRVIISVTTICFDIFFLETILPFLRGMTVILANEDQQKIPSLLHLLLKRSKPDMIQTTPSLMQLLVEDPQCQDSFTSLSTILIGGEQFPHHLLTTLKKISPARLFNLYGPSETTIWSSIAELTGTEKITIGRPIANTQIYILDQSLNPVETGRIGEIFIGGDGVAKGYINNETLTAERFIPNPFIVGSRVYRTGDLGRWLPNGTIEFIGRNDYQIKIRGYRIELGEIENSLLKHSKVKKALVVGKNDPAGHSYLCAYIVSDTELHAENLRAYLAKSLPHYMLPSYFLSLKELPLTPNGKIDKKVLPEPNRLQLISSTRYIAPRNELERKLAELWSEALENIKIGIDDNIFDLGGDSLTIIEILSGGLPFNWGISAQDFYEYPTIRLLSAKIRGLSEDILLLPKTDLDLEDQNKNVYHRNAFSKNLEQQTILLTGATGLLGIHILEELLSTTNCKIYCLLRGNNTKERLLQSLEFYFPNLIKDLYKRVSIVNGDITMKRLGLSGPEYDLGQQIDSVIHCAANVKHYGNYNAFYDVNVAGTERIINFCIKYSIKLYHISTTSVLLLNDEFLQIEGSRDCSDTLYNSKKYGENVYIRTKLEAEKKIFASVDDGLDAVIFRVGVLSGRYSDGCFQKNIEDNALYLKLKSILNLLLIPDTILNNNIDLTPVDLCAEAITKIISSSPPCKSVYNIFNNNTLSIGQLINYFRNLGIEIEICTSDEYHQRLISISQNKDKRKLLKGLILDSSNEVYYQNRTHPKNEYTKSILENHGFRWPVINDNYVRKMLFHMVNSGFLESLQKESNTANKSS